jgi:copper resistance protein C
LFFPPGTAGSIFDLARKRDIVQRGTHWKVHALAAIGLFLAIRSTAAHAILVESTPAVNSVVRGPEISIRLRFNSRIDASRSRLTLVRPDGAIEPLKIQEQPSPDTLASGAGALKAGGHRIRWQVLASDGHITRGEILFTVAGN